MLFPMYILKDRIIKLETLNKNLKTKLDNPVQERAKIYSFIYDMKLALEELKVAFNDEEYQIYIDLLSRKMQEVKTAEEFVSFNNILSNITGALKNINFEKDFGHYDFVSSYRDYNSDKEISIDFVRSLASNINTNNVKYNVFDTSCGFGELLKVFTNPNAMKYGLEQDNYKAQKAKEVTTKVIKGEIRGSRIKNEAFDILIATCPIKKDLRDNMMAGTIVKSEKQFLQNTIKYAKPEGIILIALPYYRMHKDICTMLAKQLDNAIVVRGMGNQNEKLKMVYILGTKSNNLKDLDEEFYNKLRSCYDYNKVPTIFNTTMPTYSIKGRYVEIDLFKGSVLDMDELFSIAETSGCMDNFFNAQKVDKINENTKQPLLPFNVGQIGLVLTSGCLDGIIDEGDGHYHLVKGRVSKKTETERNIDNGIVEETEVVSNRVEINVILPNGDFKTLA